MKYFILIVSLFLLDCTTKQVQQPKYYSIAEFIQEYIDSQEAQMMEIEDE